MKKLSTIGIAITLLIGAAYAIPAKACDCDTAAAITLGLPDRLHQPWPNDPERTKEKQKKYDNTQKQEVQPTNPNPQPKGETDK